ncbi:MAG: hypothetical protein RR843_08205, partial [Clostridia bacterium]
VVCLRNRPTAGYLLIAWAAATGLYGWFGLHLFGLSILNWAQSLKLIPMLLIVVGCFVNLCQYYARRHSARHGDHPDERGRYDDRFDAAPDDLNRSMAAEVRRRKAQGARCAEHKPNQRGCCTFFCATALFLRAMRGY